MLRNLWFRRRFVVVELTDSLLNYVQKIQKSILFILTCILPDYVAHENPKEFWKNSRFENIRAGFLGRSQNS